MYAAYWGLNALPFQNAAGDGWFYESPAREEALARLLFLVERRRRCGILCGAAGTGKSTLLRVLSTGLNRSQRLPVLVDACGLSGGELLIALADALHLARADAARTYVLWRKLRDHFHGLARSGRQAVLIFDHFDPASADCERTLGQLLHAGEGSDGGYTVLIAVERSQPGTSSSLAHLADLRIELTPFDRHETGYYVYESLRRAGAERELFDPDGIDAVFALTAGLPREINRVCELSLLAGMADERRTLDAATVMAAAADLAPRVPERSFAATAPIDPAPVV